jgi:gluconate 2-dehydrogenase gamma chain
MDNKKPSRRHFLIGSLAGVSASWLASRAPEILAAHEHARNATLADPPAGFEFFSPQQADEVAAMAAQIIPSNETPGAREARVIYFIDRALATFDDEKRELYTKGLDDLRAKTRGMFFGTGKFSALEPAQQVELLKAIEKTDFFEQVRVHTIIGFFANPEYGGNYNQVGWKLIGFEDEFFFEPPFGFYDRDEHKDQ